VADALKKRGYWKPGQAPASKAVGS
jgi:hypothetical protein